MRRHLLVAVLVLAGLTLAGYWLWPRPPEPLRIGVIHSLTGTMAADESVLVDGIRLAVEEINAAGGLLGRPVEMLVADGQSDDAVFAAEAERLITDEKVSALFACWTSSCRKAVKPVVEKHGHLLFYSLQYEGLEQSPAIFYTGATANQQVIPGTQWALQQFGGRVYVVGSDYVFPRMAARLVRDAVDAWGGSVVAEAFRPLGSSAFDDIAADIARQQPDVVINLVNGSSNRSLFLALRMAGVSSVPVMSFSVTESTLQMMGADVNYPEHYATWNYFATLPGESNRLFVSRFAQRFGETHLPNDPVEASYVAALLWAQAVRYVGDTRLDLVRQGLLLQSMAAPSGIAAFDRNTRHLWKAVHVAKAEPGFRFRVIWSSGDSLRPEPFPDYRSRHDWEQLLEQAEQLNSAAGGGR